MNAINEINHEGHEDHEALSQGDVPEKFNGHWVEENKRKGILIFILDPF